jgi:hypothetical protein
VYNIHGLEARATASALPNQVTSWSLPKNIISQRSSFFNSKAVVQNKDKAAANCYNQKPYIGFSSSGVGKWL